MARRGKAAQAGDVDLANAEADAEVKRRGAAPKSQEEREAVMAEEEGANRQGAKNAKKTGKHAKAAMMICVDCNEPVEGVVDGHQVVKGTEESSGGLLCLDCLDDRDLRAFQAKKGKRRSSLKAQLEARETPLLDGAEGAEPAVDPD